MRHCGKTVGYIESGVLFSEQMPPDVKKYKTRFIATTKARMFESVGKSGGIDHGKIADDKVTL